MKEPMQEPPGDQQDPKMVVLNQALVEARGALGEGATMTDGLVRKQAPHTLQHPLMRFLGRVRSMVVTHGQAPKARLDHDTGGELTPVRLKMTQRFARPRLAYRCAAGLGKRGVEEVEEAIKVVAGPQGDEVTSKPQLRQVWPRARGARGSCAACGE